MIYLARRLGFAVLVLWAAYTVSFAVLYLLSDPVATLVARASDGSAVTPAELAELTARYGLDQPLLVQYLDRLGAALHGDLGTSFVSGQPVGRTVAEALPPTLQIATAGLVLAVVLGAGVALLATYTRRRWLAHALMGLPSLAVSLPVFWVGLMLVQLFSFQLGWLPAVGARGPEALILPAITLALPTGALIAQVLVKSMSTALAEPYVTTARAKGVGPLAVHLRHALGNAAIPALTVLGYVTGNLLAGTVVVETVFTRPGLGRVTVEAVADQDVPLVQGVVLFAAVVFVVVNLVVDLIYPLLDPRVTQAVPA
ncbi:ABC transporter permease [Actinomycetospora soli]|uniref:ABC transporter permease n=1 Tax=Actinomycetospora soli TaxID=2893887 RepID=UPI001E3EA0E3|nr:ABC transporter permease [Actinomycetospora soli]MCD2186710.1 ABC transporter permease [Actinomycetospora soli]